MNCGNIAGIDKPQILINFILELYLDLPQENERKLWKNETDFSWLTVYVYACH